MDRQTPHRLPTKIPKRFFQDLPASSTFAFLMILFLAAIARRTYDLTYASLWSDELWGVVACSQGSWWAMIQDLIVRDSHPPGYQTFLYAWMQAFGRSDVIIRIPSVAAGVAAAAYAFQLGKTHFSIIVGIIAAAIVSGSYQAIYYSQEARSYAFLMFLAPAFALYFIELFVSRMPRKHSLWSFWLVSTALVYFHYVGFVLVGSAVLLLFLVWLKDNRDSTLLPLGIKAFAPCFILYLPWLPVIYQHMTHSPDDWATPTPDINRLWQTFRFLLGPDDARLYLSLACIAAVLMLRIKRLFNHDALGITQTYRTYKHRAFACLVWLAFFPLLVFYVKSQFTQSVYTLRHFTYAIPLIAIMSACFPALLIKQISQRRLRSMGLIVWLIVLFTLDVRANMAFHVHRNYMKEDYRGAVDILRHDYRFMTGDRTKFVAASNTFLIITSVYST